MTPEVLLFILRLAGAVLLLGFFGVIAWLIYQDIRVASASLAAQERSYGHLLITACESGEPAVGTRFPLLPVTSIGRSSNNTIVVEDGYASSQHSLISRRGDLWWLEDLGSRNGTLLNELPLTETAVISPGDIITIGETKLKIEIDS
jgi:hypothetical protein